jgi:hypothetical protein
VTHAHHLESLETEIWGPVIHTIFRDRDVEFYLGVNTWQGREWLNAERLPEMLQAMLLTILIRSFAAGSVDWDHLATVWDFAQTLEEAAEGTGYDYGWMLSCVK